jgi:NAD(P)-dependent dehydrogenase (short-subunit alcohol dehydrogenase family)
MPNPLAVPSFRLDGMAAVVTGAAGGIGAAVAFGAAASGASVACLDRPGTPVADTVEAIRAVGGTALALPADVTDPDAMAAAVEQAQDALGGLRLAVNCAGIHSTGPAEEMARTTWQAVLDVNLTGVFLSCQAEGAAMLRGGGGSIVNIGSVSATIANRGLKQAQYNAAKAGVVQLSRSLALEWADRGVRVNVVSPGYVRTAMSRGAETSRSRQDYLDDIPMHRMADPAEVVGPVVFLLSPAASYCTGTELVVDGGLISW